MLAKILEFLFSKTIGKMCHEVYVSGFKAGTNRVAVKKPKRVKK